MKSARKYNLFYETLNMAGNNGLQPFFKKNTRDISCEQTYQIILISFIVGAAEVDKESAQVKYDAFL